MANQEQVELLRQGVEVWNKWRAENRNAIIDFISVDFSQAYLNGADLSGAFLVRTSFCGANLFEANFNGAYLNESDFSRANLTRAMLIKSDLSRAVLAGANLTKSNFCEADLANANFSDANLTEANLTRANLSETNFIGTNLTGTNLSETKLGGTKLSEAKFVRTNLSGANFGGAVVGSTFFSNIDFSRTYRLDAVSHFSPSTVGTNTIQLSKGEIPQVFLRGCGLSDLDIEYSKLYKPGLSNQEINDIIYKIFDLRANQAIQVSPLFISYSHADIEFVEKLEPCLTEKGIRFWGNQPVKSYQ